MGLRILDKIVLEVKEKRGTGKSAKKIIRKHKNKRERKKKGRSKEERRYRGQQRRRIIKKRGCREEKRGKL